MAVDLGDFPFGSYLLQAVVWSGILCVHLIRGS